MKIRFYKTGEINDSSYVKIPLRSNASINDKNKDKHCSIWSILASLHPCDKDHPNTVSNCLQKFTGINSDGFDFSNECKCSDVQKLEKINKLSIKLFELNFYQEKTKWKHNLIPIEISKRRSL